MPDNPQTNRQWISWKSSKSISMSVGRAKPGTLFFQIVPWLNAFVIVALFMVISNRLTIAPSVGFELPQARFTEGTETGPGLVMLRPDAGKDDTLIFFDDVRYRVGSEDETKLSEHIARYAKQSNGAQILLLADKNVLHGDVMSIVNLARRAGVARVNVAIKPE